MYTLYTLPGSCSTGIVVLLEKLGAEYTTINRNKVSNYKEFVPTNQVPALKVEDGQVITEGAAIALYLLEKHNSPMLPTDLGKKAEFLRWMMFDYATLHPSYSRMFVINFKMKIDDKEKASVLKQAAETVSSFWAILDRELEKKKFITGDEPTLVDYLAAIYASWGKSIPDAHITLGKNVERLIDDVCALPEFKAAYTKENITYKR